MSPPKRKKQGRKNKIAVFSPPFVEVANKGCAYHMKHIAKTRSPGKLIAAVGAIKTKDDAEGTAGQKRLGIG